MVYVPKVQGSPCLRRRGSYSLAWWIIFCRTFISTSFFHFQLVSRRVEKCWLLLRKPHSVFWPTLPFFLFGVFDALVWSASSSLPRKNLALVLDLLNPLLNRRAQWESIYHWYMNKYFQYLQKRKAKRSRMGNSPKFGWSKPYTRPMHVKIDPFNVLTSQHYLIAFSPRIYSNIYFSTTGKWKRWF